MRGEIVQATIDHAMQVTRRLRREDRAELEALSTVDPAIGVFSSMTRSYRTWAWLIDGEAACIGGVGPNDMVPGADAPWLLSTALVGLYRRDFMEGSRQMVERLVLTSPYLASIVDARYVRCIGWLRWLGFTVLDPHPIGPQGMLFCDFEMKR